MVVDAPGGGFCVVGLDVKNIAIFWGVLGVPYKSSLIDRCLSRFLGRGLTHFRPRRGFFRKILDVIGQESLDKGLLSNDF